MHLAWTSDLHVDYAARGAWRSFCDAVKASGCHALLVCGDIADGPCLVEALHELHDSVHCPVWFVLGNHDHWGRLIQDVRDRVQSLVASLPHLTYLSACRGISVDARTCVIGHDGWADGRYGDYARSTVVLPDYVNVRDFVPLGKWPRRELMQQLADAAADHVRGCLTAACESHRRVIVVTHVPPFAEACRYRGDRCEEQYLPHYSCQAMGNVLLEAAGRWPDREFVVLCGHTHEAVELTVLPNLLVRVAGASYGHPRIAGEIPL